MHKLDNGEECNSISINPVARTLSPLPCNETFNNTKMLEYNNFVIQLLSSMVLAIYSTIITIFSIRPNNKFVILLQRVTQAHCQSVLATVIYDIIHQRQT